MNKSGLPFLLLQLFGFISRRRRYQSLLLLSFTLLSTIAEVFSLGSVVPFIAALTQPEKLFQHPLMSGFIQFFKISSPQDLIIPLTITFIIAACIAGSLRILLVWLSIRLSNLIGVDLSTQIYRLTLYQDYAVHISRSTSEIISGITQKVGAAITILLALITAATATFLFFSICITLIFIDPFIALVALSLFGTCYLIIALISRNRLLVNSATIAQEQTNVIKSLQESLGGIRDILLSGDQEIYTKSFRESIHKLRFAHGSNSYINQAPRFVLESLGMILIATLAYYLSFRPGGINDALPVLGVLALGAQRLLPVLHILYGNWSVVLGGSVSLVNVLELLRQKLPSYADKPDPKPLLFKHSIGFNDASFRYSTDSHDVIKNLNFSLKKGEKVGIFGTTGGGKSTTLDILMLLLEATKGHILVDGNPITKDTRRSWQLSIAHVPQSVFLTDNSILNNIALGVPTESIDLDRVKEAARRAQISEFIESLAEGYKTLVGERGVRLSGGQRQRIALARAFYRKASLLIFDEATSALDTETERAVMNAINTLEPDLTIIMIAHRLTTLKNTDKIIQLEDGKIVFEGTYQDLEKIKEELNDN